MTKYFTRKFYRLKTSKNYLKFIKLLHKLFGEKFLKEIEIPKFYDYSIHRKEIINKIIKFHNFKDYLEIGCDQNELFLEVQIQNKVGVDPNNGGTHRMTSDDFFLENKDKFDLIFIDGLHIYNQVLKDIHNSVNCLKENGLILLHDCFPFNYYDQAIPRAQKKWNGDVWKAITEMRTLSYLDTYVGAFDNGIGLILKRKNTMTLKKPAVSFKKLKYEDYYNNYENYLNLISTEKFFKIINELK
ncbi:class I SAM-dependent methyltransferase [Candidatus Pelagibacter sp.]|nr:class I SAM-dependent methyltransferase [Candidatus Pelagibacter sp.]